MCEWVGFFCIDYMPSGQRADLSRYLWHAALHVLCMGGVGGITEQRLSLAGARVTLSLLKVRNYAPRPRNFGTPPLNNPKCQHCRLYQPRGDVHMPLWVKTQCEEIPKAERTTRGPFKSTLPRCCARRERERALINNNTVLRSRFYRIQLITAASVKKRWGNISDIEQYF